MTPNDGFGRMTHYSRFAGAFTTEWREDGYYFAHPVHTSQGGYTPFTGPYASREAAKSAETESLRKKRR